MSEREKLVFSQEQSSLQEQLSHNEVPASKCHSLLYSSFLLKLLVRGALKKSRKIHTLLLWYAIGFLLVSIVLSDLSVLRIIRFTFGLRGKIMFNQQEQLCWNWVNLGKTPFSAHLKLFQELNVLLFTFLN